MVCYEKLTPDTQNENCFVLTFQIIVYCCPFHGHNAFKAEGLKKPGGLDSVPKKIVLQGEKPNSKQPWQILEN